MLADLRKLWLGLSIIVAASVLLVMTDASRRPRAAAGPSQRVTLLCFSSIQPVEEAAASFRARLEQLTGPGMVELRKLNAEGDVATLRQMAVDALSARPDLLVSFTTPALQSVVAANRDGMKHVFGLVVDPFIAGVGLDRAHPADKPAWLTGIATPPPARRLFEAARSMNPALKRLGVVWNPAESNSVAGVTAGREAAKALGIELLEANATSPTEARTAVDSLLARGIDAFWILADINAQNSAPALIGACRQQKVPVITSVPVLVRQGAMLGVGADYDVLGRQSAELAARVLQGTSPADIPVSESIPVRVAVDPGEVAHAGGRWVLPETIRSQADEVIGHAPPERAAPQAAPDASIAGGAPSAPRRVLLGYYGESLLTEETVPGILEGLREEGFGEGTLMVERRNGQFDLATTDAIFAGAEHGDAEVVVALTTNALQAALRRVKSKPIVFTVVASPFLAGAGRSPEDHAPNLTGVSSVSDFDAMVDAILRVWPDARRVGTVYTPSELNSEFHKHLFELALKRRGMQLVAKPADRASDIPSAADAVIGDGVDVLAQINDSTTASSLGTILQAATRRGVPGTCFLSEGLKRGAVLVVARDYHAIGRQTGQLVAKVLKGARPADLPIQPASETLVQGSAENAARFGRTLPPDLLDGRTVRTTGWPEGMFEPLPGGAR